MSFMTSAYSNTYTHLSPTERGQIQALSETGFSMRKIALKLGRNVSTISREFKRNRTTQLDYQGKYYDAYFADTAQIYYHKRRKACHPKDYYLKAQDFFNQLTTVIKAPFRKDGIDGFIANYKQMYPNCPCPSTPTVYRLIDQGKLAIKNGDLPRKVRLRHSGHHRKRTRQHKKRLGNSIEQIPKAADKRGRSF